jgi:hypothetical protein
LHVPSVVLERVAGPEEERAAPEGRGAKHFDVQLVNTSNDALILPSGLVVGMLDEVENVREFGGDLDTVGGAEAFVAVLSAMSVEQQRTTLSALDTAPEGLQEFLVANEDKEPDQHPPTQEALAAMVADLDLSEGQKAQFLELLGRYAHVFAANPSAPEQAGVDPHRIRLEPGTKPVFKHQYRLSQFKREELARQVREKVEAGIIQPSRSSFAAPVVLAPKHDGSWRFCVDYRDLNKVTVPDKFPLPRIDDLLDQLGNNVFFSTMDLAAGFYQIPVAEEDRHKTAFSTPEGLFEWVRMPMGLTNSPATFQRAMNLTLSGLNWTTCLVYLDDIICFATSFQEHLDRLEGIFERLSEGGFSLKLTKCSFFQKEVEYLGHVVNAEGRKPHPRNLKAVREFPRPVEGRDFVTHVQAFVGLTNYYADYIPDYVQKREPLTRLTKKGIAKLWGPEQEEAFELLKADLCADPLIRHPDFSKRFYVQTDACGYGIGAVLTQEFEDGFHPILYLSRSLSEPERKWAARELEALAVVWAVTKLRPYLEGRDFTVQTDHESLQWLMRTEAPGRLSRWAMTLQEYLPRMTIEYRRGDDNGNADGLSRRPLPLNVLSATQRSFDRYWVHHDLFEEFNSLLFELRSECSWAPRVGPEMLGPLPVYAFGDAATEEEMEPELQPSETQSFMEDVRQGYQADSKWSQLVAYLTDPDTDELSEDERRDFEYRAEHFSLKSNGLLFLRTFFRRNPKDPRRRIERLVIPDSLRFFLIASLHDSLTGVHLGSPRVSFALRRRYYWPAMDAEVREYVRTCPLCQRAKATRQRRAGLLQPKGWGRPGMLGVDLQGPFPTSHGYDMIITIKDVFLGKTVLVPLTTRGSGTDAAACADAVFERWVAYHGIPRLILTDKGPQFQAQLFARFCERLGIKRAKTATYHAQTNSQVERQHGFHGPLLKAVTAFQPSGWSLWLPYLQFAVNSSVVEGLGISPLEAETGLPARLPTDLYTLREDDYSFEKDKYQHKIEHPKRMKQIHSLMRRVKKERDEKMKDRYDKTARDVSYAVGDTVLAYKPAAVKGSRKLVLDWRGPFDVTRIVGPNTYMVRLCGKPEAEPWPVNVQNTNRYYVRKPLQRNTWLDVDTELPRPVRPPRIAGPAQRKSPRLLAREAAESAAAGEAGGAAASEEKSAAASEAASGETAARDASPAEETEEGKIALLNELLAHVFLAPSPGRGTGVFCRLPGGIREGLVLGEYTGRRLSGAKHDKEFAQGKDCSYALQLDFKDLVIDSADWRSSKWPRYINGAGAGETANVRFVEVRGRAMVIASRAIEAGEELLVEYGDDYWEKRAALRRSGNPALRLPLPPLAEAAAAFEEHVQNTALGESARVQGAEAKASPPQQSEVPADVEVGKFVLVMHEPPPCRLELAEVVGLDELREFATVHTYGNYSGRLDKPFLPCYIDPADDTWLFTRRPKPRQANNPSLRTVYDEHIASHAFLLTKTGRLPKPVQEVDWDIDVGAESC